METWKCYNQLLAGPWFQAVQLCANRSPLSVTPKTRHLIAWLDTLCLCFHQSKALGQSWQAVPIRPECSDVFPGCPL